MSRIRLLRTLKLLFLLLFLGCGRYAGGQGYNSIGHFCGGWAGNCGDGGIGGSTWYLVCDRCREKYLREKQAAAREKVFLFCSGYTVSNKNKSYKIAVYHHTILDNSTELMLKISFYNSNNIQV